MKKFLKLILILFLIFSINFSIISNISIADSKAQDDLNRLDSSTDSTGANEKVQSVLDTIVVVTQIVATGVALFILTVLAMKYMAASPGDKADIKKSAGIYLVGAIIVFAVPQILKIINSFAKVIK